MSSIGPIAGRRTSDRDRKMSEEEDCKSGLRVNSGGNYVLYRADSRADVR